MTLCRSDTGTPGIRLVMLGYVLLLALFLASGASAQGLPTSNFATAPLVTPDEAFIYFDASGTTRTSSQNLIGTDLRPGRSDEIKTLAVGLGKDDLAAGRITQDEYAKRAFEYVRFNLETTFNFGLTKGAHGALIDQSGSAFDNASLFAELLREAGITAAYEAGTINLNAEEFGRWTGLVVPTAWDPDGKVTSFTVAAQGACQLLANGGIPATINGGADPNCAGAGNLSSVQLAHVWVAALGRKYDPAYKKQEIWKGNDLAVAMQCGSETAQTCSSGAQSAAMSSVSRGTFSGTVPWTQNVNANALGSTLTTYAQRLQSAIVAADRNASREQWIGGTTLMPLNHINDAMTPIGASVRNSWTEIPDQYRIRFSVQFDNINRSFWADEISAERLRIFGLGSHFVPSAGSFTRTTTLYLEFNPLATSFRTGATLNNDNLTLTVNYPYAANGGSYQDSVSTRDPWATMTQQYSSSDAEAFVQPITIIHQFGTAHASSIAEASRTQEDSKRRVKLVDPTNTAHDVLFSRTITMNQKPCLKQNLWTKIEVGPGLNYVSDPGCLRLHEPTMLQQLIAQDTELQSVAGAVSGGKVITHHLIGSFGGGAMNVETSRSAVQADGDTAKVSGLKLASSLMTGWLEGGVFEQGQGEWEGESGLSLMFRSNEKGHRFLQLNSSNITAGLAQMTNYSATEKSLVSSFTSAGFRVIAPQSTSVGQFDFGSAHVQFFQNGLGVFKPGYSDLGTLVNDGFKGATPGAVDPAESALKSSKAIMEGFRPDKFLSADLNDAAASLGTFDDVAAGVGEFPDRLVFQRTYSSSSQVTATEQTLITLQDAFSGGATFSHLKLSGLGSRIGGGWGHNYEIGASIDSDGFQGMGSDSALDASRFLAGLYSLVKLGQAAPSFDSELAALFTAYWTGEQLASNVVNIKSPGADGTYVRLADGTFNSPPAMNSRLVQIGERSGAIPAGGSFSVVYDYSTVTFQLTDPTGGEINFNLAGESFYSINFGVVFTNLRQFKPLRWTFPDGKYLNFQYVRQGGYTSSGQAGQTDCLTTVTNHLGRQLTIGFAAQPAGDLTACVIGTVSNDIGQSVTYSGMRTGHINAHIGSPYWGPFTFTVTRIDGSHHYFDYNATMDNPASAVVDSDIVAWRNDARTYLSIGYDSFQRIASVDDGLAQRRNYAVGGLFSEGWKHTQVRDPLGAATVGILDSRGHSLVSVDPLGFRRWKVYDHVGRLTIEINSELDSSTYVYDQKSNVTQRCKLSKTRVGQACTTGTDPIRQTTFVEAGAACSNFRTCSKPAFDIDANGHRSNYEWSPVHGGLLSETNGLDAAGVCIIVGGCPLTTYGYSAFPGADGSSFHLLTSKTVKIDSATSTVTTFGYDPANHYALREVVADSGGANLRTCFKFDSAGNLISKTEPNGALTFCP